MTFQSRELPREQVLAKRLKLLWKTIQERDAEIAELKDRVKKAERNGKHKWAIAPVPRPNTRKLINHSVLRKKVMDSVMAAVEEALREELGP